ncbi:MAG: Stp1/IreP family PP2C-type Ser/Thr phosphatase [Oscillospiraceae bacterium]|jgi:protein phosphatase|nr:Stp1/IreP family PP2C-type Ser/Thr phosphatase [Oscillospiraceae bacterium]
MIICGQTDRGKVRKMNQDAYGVWDAGTPCVFAVCDGMGGASAGDVASELAIREFMNEITRSLPPGERTDMNADGMSVLLTNAVLRAGGAVFERGISDPDCLGMGTTLVACMASPDIAVIANVGDSRAYYISPGVIRRITRDHSIVEDLIERGELTEEQARNHPKRNLITRSLGASRVERPDIFEAAVLPGDMILLCTDGLTNVLLDEEIYLAAMSAGSPEKAVAELVRAALERGAPDNVTAALCLM